MTQFKPGDWVKLIYQNLVYYGKISKVEGSKVWFRIRKRPDGGYRMDSEDVFWESSNLVYATDAEIKNIPRIKGDILRYVSGGCDYAVEYEGDVNGSFEGKVVYSKLNNNGLSHANVGGSSKSYTIEAFHHLISPHAYMQGAPVATDVKQEEEVVYKFKKGELALRKHTDETIILMITDRSGHFANTVIINSTDPRMPIGTAIIGMPISNMEPLLNTKINITLNN